MDRTGEWRQILLDIEPGSYQFFFASFLNDESELGDKAIDDILVEEGTCTGLPGETCFLHTFAQVLPGHTPLL